MHPARHQRRLPRDHLRQQRAIGVRISGDLRIMPRDHVIRERADRIAIVARGKELEGADPDMAGRDTGQDRAWQQRLAPDDLAGQDRGERARGRDAQGGHRLADDILPEHGTERRAAVAAPGERGGARALQLQVAALAVAVDHFTEQDSAAVAELRHEIAELMPRIGGGDGIGAGRNRLPREIADTVR